MDINLLEVLPVSKPPPESAVRPANPGGDVRRGDSPSFEQTLRARQKEEKQTQAQAEAAASQSAAAAVQQPGVESESQPNGAAEQPSQGSPDQLPARISGGLPALLNEGVLLPTVEGNPSALVDTEAQPAEALLSTALPVVEEGALVEGEVDFASALEKSLSQPAQTPVVQTQTPTEVNKEQNISTEISPEAAKVETPLKAKSSGEAQAAQPASVESTAEHQPLFHSVQAGTNLVIPPEPAPIQARTLVDVVRQIASQMEASIQQGRSSIRVQLHPQELGGIDIRFASSAQGVSVTVYAEQASTGRLLEAQLNQLRQSLNDAGVNLAQLNIHHESPSHQSQGGLGGQSPRGRWSGGREISQEGSQLVERGERWQNLSVSGVDYRI